MGSHWRTLRHQNRGGITSVAFGPDGTKLVSADLGETGRVRVWDLRTGDRLAEWVGEAPVVFRSADQVVGRRGGKVVIWSLGEAEPVREIDALRVPSRSRRTAGGSPRPPTAPESGCGT